MTKPFDVLLRNLNKNKEVLAASQEELNTIIRTVPDIIYRLDANRRITFISNAVEEYGYQPMHLIGKDFFDLIHIEDREKAKYRIVERRTGIRI